MSDDRGLAGLDEISAALEQAERRLRVERARYFELFDLAPVGYAVTDRHGIFLEVNRATTELLGIPGRNLVGKPFANFVPSPERAEFRQWLIDLVRSPGTRSREVPLVSRRGRRIDALMTVTPSQADGAETAEFRWVVQDLTERIEKERSARRLAEELEARVADRTAELEQERARLAAVVRHMPTGVLLADPRGRLLATNDRARQILGNYEAVPGLDALRETLDSGRPIDNRRVEIPRSRSPLVLAVSAAPVRDVAGSVLGAVAVFQDVTAVERRERAERQFVTNAAHQLQSPLAGILSAVEVLQAGAKDKPERDVFLGHVERETRRLAGLARALLVLARAEGGYEAPKDELVGVAPMLEDIASTLRPAPGVDVEVSCDPAIAVVTNRDLVEQALMNLADNAAKFTTSGRITLAARAGKDSVELSVSDTGSGISVEERERVLERFYRATADGTEGFGLGLAIVRAAVAAVEGRIEVESEVGAGTRVRIELPRPASLVAT